MKHRKSIQTWRTSLGGVSILLGGLMASSAWAQTSHHNLDLADFLSQRGLASSDIRGMATAIAPTDLGWSIGHSEEIRSGYLKLTPVGGMSGASGHSLQVFYNPIFLQPIRIDGCASRSHCSELSVEVDSVQRSLNFSLDGNLWQMKLGDAPCRENVSCAFNIPSWALENRRLSGSSSLSPLPATTTVVDFGGWLALFNASSGKHWMNIHFPTGVSSWGALKSASTSEDGRLSLVFLSAHLLLDFDRDRAILADSNGVAVSSAGIADLSSGHWDFGYSKIDSSQSLLAFTDELVIWSDGYLPLGLGSDSINFGNFVDAYETWHAVAVSPVAVGDAEIFILSENSGGIRLKAYDAKEQMFVATSASWPSGSVLASDVLVRQSVMRLSDGGSHVLSEVGFVPTSLSMSDRSIFLLGSGSAFVEQIGGDQCRYVHYNQHVNDFGSFKESGFSAPCGVQPAFSANLGGVTATSRVGDVIQVSVQRQ